MGWSCASAAYATMERWVAQCRKQTNSSNVFEVKGVRHFFENPTDEHDDGAITGEVFMCLAEGKCRRVDTFRIEPDGSVTHAPDFFKKVGA